MRTTHMIRRQRGVTLMELMVVMGHGQCLE